LDALAQDLGAILGGGGFHSGKVLGFPLGFDVGAHAVVTGVQDDNLTFKDDGSTEQGYFGQVEVGLPARINLLARGGQVADGDMLGGGISLGILKSDVPGLPSLSVSALYNQLDHDYLDAKTYSVNAALSIEFPLIDPYIGAGYDYTTLDPTAKAFAETPASVDRSLEGKSSGYRVEVGANLHLLPFTYLTLAAGLANGQELYHAAAGVRF